MTWARLLTFAVILGVAGALAADFRATAPKAATTAPVGEGAPSQPVDDDAPSVAKVCGFAPCGMPLPCD